MIWIIMFFLFVSIPVLCAIGSEAHHVYKTHILPINVSGWFPEEEERIDYLLSVPYPIMYLNDDSDVSFGLRKKPIIPIRKTITHNTWIFDSEKFAEEIKKQRS